LIELVQAEQPVLSQNDCHAAGGPSTEGRPVIEPLANDPDDDGNAIVGVRYAVLIELVIVALVVLLRWLL
jgi:hypothetical protein